MRCFISCLTLLVCLSATSSAQRGPIKVFVLAGQSNMEGKGAVAHLETLAASKDSNVEFGSLRQDREWKPRSDVWISYDRARGGRKVGDLSVGFGSNDQQIGPELGFGNIIGDALEEQVLLIKCCWGGASLGKDFLPPGSGGPGPYYKKMLDEIRGVLSRLKTHFPGYAGQGYELAGFVWFQGWNDAVGQGNPRYRDQLAQLIRDLRKDLSAPDLAFVIGELGQGGRNPNAGAAQFRAQQAAVARLPEFAGTVRYTPTSPYIDPRFEELFEVWRRCRDRERQLPEGHDAAAKTEAWAEWKPLEEEWNLRAADLAYHYYGSGEIFYRIGLAFGRSMADLLKLEVKAPVETVQDADHPTDTTKPKDPAALPEDADDHIARRKKLQPQIDAAMDAGIDWLKSRQLRDGSWGQNQAGYATGQTALSIYTLLKCGVSKDDLSIRRGMRFIETHPPTQTYVIGCVLMALEAADSKHYKKRIKALHKQLLRMQRPDGGWSYELNGRSDLSNTQYAALGIRAAMLSGLRTPPKTLKKLAFYTSSLQGKPSLIKIPAGITDGKKYGAVEGQAAGFFYDSSGNPGHSSAITGSMTCAGISVLAIVRDAYGRKVPGSVSRQIQKGFTYGENWLQANWAIEKNPGAEGNWHHYYLYGLERVGALLGREIFAGHPWYVEGAEHLVKSQEKDGRWNDESITCFCLLFLQRATWNNKGVSGQRGERSAHATSSGDVLIRGSGNESLSIWIHDFSRSIKERFQASAANSNLRIVKVDYVIDDEVAGQKAGDLTHSWRDESYAHLHRFQRNGSYKVQVRVHLLPPGAESQGADTKLEVIQSEPFHVFVQSIKDPMAEDIALAGSQGLLKGVAVRHSASSKREHNGDLKFSVDGKEGTAWVADKSDENPTLELKFTGGIIARYILISPAPQSLAKGEVASVAIHVNDEKRAHVGKSATGHEALRIDLGKRRQIKSLKVKLQKAKPNTEVGVAELYFLK